MKTFAAPLLVFKIAAIVMMALAVHAVQAGDPAYGSDLKIRAETVLKASLD